MASKKWILIAALGGLTIPVVANLNTNYSEAIRDYDFKGVKFGTELRTLHKLFPMVSPSSESDREIGLLLFSVDDVPGTDGVTIGFLDSACFLFAFQYSASTIKDMGGYHPIKNRIVERFGKPSENSEGMDLSDQVGGFEWIFVGVDRAIYLNVKPKVTMARFMQKSIFAKMLDRKRHPANVGF
jgi:hypothetical protein